MHNPENAQNTSPLSMSKEALVGAMLVEYLTLHSQAGEAATTASQWIKARGLKSGSRLIINGRACVTCVKPNTGLFHRGMISDGWTRWFMDPADFDPSRGDKIIDPNNREDVARHTELLFLQVAMRDIYVDTEGD